MLFVFARVNCIQLTGDRMNRLLIRSQCSLREFASLDINQIKTIRQRKQNENKKKRSESENMANKNRIGTKNDDE